MALEGCAADFTSFCGNRTVDFAVGAPHESTAPYVKVKFHRSGKEITVGNKSSPDDNDATIKYFEYGSSDGFTVKLTIHDQQGGDFTVFMEDVVKKVEEYKPGFQFNMRMEFEFGWIRSGCPQPVATNFSSRRCGIVDNVECAFAEGKFIYDITGMDTPQSGMFEHKFDKIFGNDGAAGFSNEDGTSQALGEVPLRVALETMLTGPPEPRITKVSFLTNKDGPPHPIGFLDPVRGDPLGPRSKWIASKRGKIDTAREWIKGWLSENERPFIMQYNEDGCADEITFWEDTRPNCGESINPNNCAGSFVVNGGKESSVIEFNPRFRWNFGTLDTGGQATDGKPLFRNDEKDGHLKGRFDCTKLAATQRNGGGSYSTGHSTEVHLGQVGPKEAEEKHEKAFHLYSKAKKIGRPDAIEANMVIVGDPQLLPPKLGIGTKFVSIAFINPYFLRGQTCAEWMVKGPCNKILSNKAWRVESITHKIQPGTFTTTLQVYLAAPGVDIDPGEMAGGKGSMGWVPKI